MAERIPVITFENGAEKIVWTGLLNSDTGAPVYRPLRPGKTVEGTGTFGVGGSVSLKSARSGQILTDPQANAITKAAAFVEEIQENADGIYPHVTAGDGTTNLTITVRAV